MIPDRVLSTEAHYRPFARPVRGYMEYLQDYELAGYAIRDGTKGMMVRVWTVYVVQNSQVWVKAQGVAPSMLFDRGVNILELALAFDNNMNPVVAFREGAVGTVGNSYRWWFDSTDSTQKFTALAAGVRSLRACVDDHRPSESGSSDVVVTYIRGQNLCATYQRERYAVEDVLASSIGPNAEIVDVSMNNVARLQWHMKNTASIPGAAVFNDPALGDIVMDLCVKSGIGRDQVDTSGLYGVYVPGLKVEIDQGLDKAIDWLREIYNFDKVNADRNIRFVMRGGDVKARIPYTHLLEGNPEALAVKIRDQSKLPKLVEVVHLDPTAGYAKNKQAAFRRTNTVNARAKPKIETTVVLTPDQAATAAMVKLKVDWNELRDYEFSTSIRYAFLTETDIVEVEDANGVWNRMRIEEKNEDEGELKWTCIQDAGPVVYGSAALGNALDEPISTTPGLVGPTEIEIVNCSPLRDQDDELGVYIAAAGTNSAWTGFTMLVSTDGGLSYTEAYEASSPATIGVSESDLLADDYLYQGNSQTLRVVVNFPLSSAGYDQLLTNANRCAIGDEIVQFATATLVDQPDGKYRYDLSGLVRGRYNTQGDHWPSGTRFVLLDESLVFVRAQQWMVGLDIEYKPVTNGSNVDETVATSYLFDDPQSQTEWPPYALEATRDSGNLLVSWVGRARLGLDTNSYNSKYFTGYRVKFSDGHSIDSLNQTAVYPSAPAGLTMTVCALNSITGEGPASAPITA